MVLLSLGCLGEKPDPDQVFRLSSLQSFSVAPPPASVSPAQNPSHRLDTALMETPQDTLVNTTNVEFHKQVSISSAVFKLSCARLTPVRLASTNFSLNHFCPIQELNRLNLESSGKLVSDLSVSYIDSPLISPEAGSLLGNSVSMATAGSLLAKQNKPKSGWSLMGGPTALSPLTPR